MAVALWDWMWRSARAGRALNRRSISTNTNTVPSGSVRYTDSTITPNITHGAIRAPHPLKIPVVSPRPAVAERPAAVLDTLQTLRPSMNLSQDTQDQIFFVSGLLVALPATGIFLAQDLVHTYVFKNPGSSTANFIYEVMSQTLKVMTKPLYLPVLKALLYPVHNVEHCSDGYCCETLKHDMLLTEDDRSALYRHPASPKSPDYDYYRVFIKLGLTLLTLFFLSFLDWPRHSEHRKSRLRMPPCPDQFARRGQGILQPHGAKTLGSDDLDCWRSDRSGVGVYRQPRRRLRIPFVSRGR